MAVLFSSFPKSCLFCLLTVIISANACESVQGVKMTFYGYTDNDPPSPNISYDCGRGYEAGGSGTYSDPLTVAGVAGNWKRCEVLYIPYLRKYVRYEDECGSCAGTHLDIWDSSNHNGGDDEINCENALTPATHQGVIRSPASSYPVDTTGFYSDAGHCRVSHTYYNNPTSNYC